jgi:low affinity Fe/Cu permease
MSKKFAQLANYVAEVSGNPGIFGAAALTVVLWLATGPVFAYSDTWQLVMNTWTNVVTFLMVFLIQNSQNRDSSALQAKIDELIRSSAARNTFVGIEQLTPEEIDEIRKIWRGRSASHSGRAGGARGLEQSSKREGSARGQSHGAIMNESNAEPAFEARQLKSAPGGTSGSPGRTASGTTFPDSFRNRKRCDGSKRKRAPGSPSRHARRSEASPRSAAPSPRWRGRSCARRHRDIQAIRPRCSVLPSPIIRCSRSAR